MNLSAQPSSISGEKRATWDLPNIRSPENVPSGSMELSLSPDQANESDDENVVDPDATQKVPGL